MPLSELAVSSDGKRVAVGHETVAIYDLVAYRTRLIEAYDPARKDS